MAKLQLTQILLGLPVDSDETLADLRLEELQALYVRLDADPAARIRRS